MPSALPIMALIAAVAAPQAARQRRADKPEVWLCAGGGVSELLREDTRCPFVMLI